MGSTQMMLVHLYKHISSLQEQTCDISSNKAMYKIRICVEYVFQEFTTIVLYKSDHVVHIQHHRYMLTY